MIDLFRYIEHDFVVPVATDAIDVTNQSDFQTTLRDAAQGEGAVARQPAPRRDDGGRERVLALRRERYRLQAC